MPEIPVVRPFANSSPVRYHGQTMIRLDTYRPDYRDGLIAFWNAAFAGRRNFHPLTVQEWEERVISSPAFDARGLILAIEAQGRKGAEEQGRKGAGAQVVGGIHALRPVPREGVYQLYFDRHHIAWLMVAEAWRGQGIGSRLLQAAESWLYYCPVHFAAETVPLYGSVEGPLPPWFGSSQRMGISLADDRPLIQWLARRGYRVVEAGDVSLARDLVEALAPPAEPDWDQLGLRPVAIGHQRPWTSPGYDELQFWGDNGGRPYAGTVLAHGRGTAVGRIVWYPFPAPRIPARAAILRLDVAEAWRQRGLGSYLLDRTLHELWQAGFASVEVQTHVEKHRRAFELYQRRKFMPEAAWANLAKQ